MKKTKLIPSVLILILCLGVLGVGIYAATPANNKISGTIKVNAASANVEITGYIGDDVDFPEESTRTGISWTLDQEKITFTPNVNNVNDVDDIIVKIKIKNKSQKALGAYFYNKTDDKKTPATDQDIATYTQISCDGKPLADAFLSSYAYISPYDDNATNTDNDIVFMTATIRLTHLYDDKDMYGDIDLILNIEEYESNVDAEDLTAVSGPDQTGSPTVSGFVKLSDDASFTELPIGCFHKNKNITYAVIPNNITTLNNACFTESSIKGISLSRNVNSVINGRAFVHGTLINNINIPDWMTSISYTFAYSCANLKCVNLPNELKEIGYDAFGRCTSLEKIKIPNTLEKIGEYAFYLCTSLEKIEIPNTLEKISEYAFSGCTSLEELKLPEVDSATIHAVAFMDSGLKGTFYLPNNYVLVGDSNGQFMGTKITDFKVDADNNRYMTIDGILYERGSYVQGDELYNVPVYLQAFPTLSYVKNFVLPSTVTGMRRYELANAKLLRSISVEEGNEAYSSFDGILYDASGKGALTIPQAYNKTKVVINNGTRIIGGVYNVDLEQNSKTVAGYGLGSTLTEIVLPESTIIIAGCAFQDCDTLSKLNTTEENTVDLTGLPNLNRIGYKAFERCTSMKTLKIGKCDGSGTEKQIVLEHGFIGDAVNLETIYIEAEIPPQVTTGAYASTIEANFAKLTKLKQVVVPKGKLQTYIDSPYWSCLAGKIVEAE